MHRILIFLVCASVGLAVPPMRSTNRLDTLVVDQDGLLSSPQSFFAANNPGAINVRWHGAKGDGAHNDWEGIQRAVDAVCVAGGGTVFIPPGVYNISSNTVCVWGSNIKISGYGSTLYKNGSAGEIGDVLVVEGNLPTRLHFGYLNFSGGGSYATKSANGINAASTNVVVEGLTVRFDSGLSGQPVNGIGSENCRNVVFRDCVVIGAPKTAFASIATDNFANETIYDNCLAIDARNHAFRGIAYTTTEDPVHTFVSYTFKNCKAVGTINTLTNAPEPELHRLDVDLFLRSTFNTNCIYVVDGFQGQQGMVFNYPSGSVDVRNSRFGFVQCLGAYSSTQIMQPHIVLHNLLIDGSAEYPPTDAETNAVFGLFFDRLYMGSVTMEECSVSNKVVITSVRELTVENNTFGAPCTISDSYGSNLITNIKGNYFRTSTDGIIAGNHVNLHGNYFDNVSSTWPISAVNANVIANTWRVVSNLHDSVISSPSAGIYKWNRVLNVAPSDLATPLVSPRSGIDIENNSIIDSATGTTFVDYGGMSDTKPVGGNYSYGMFVKSSSKASGVRGWFRDSTYGMANDAIIMGTNWSYWVPNDLAISGAASAGSLALSGRGNINYSGLSGPDSGTTPNGALNLEDSTSTSLGLSLGIDSGSTATWIQSRQRGGTGKFTLQLNPSGGAVVVGPGGVTSQSLSVGTGGPTITSGSVAPSASEPNGSLYLRTNGQLWHRTNSTWTTY